MSGITATPFLSSILSAIGVVGPFAPSTTMSALILPALSPVIWFSMAAGISTSTSDSRSSAFVMGVP